MPKKTINLLYNDEISLRERSRIEGLISAWQDFAYGYDIEEEAFDAIVEALQDLDIDFELLEEPEEDDLSIAEFIE